VIGLDAGAEVYLNGIKVGTVDDLAVAPEDIRKVAVTIEVDAGTPIHADTRATLQLAGITGLKVIDLRDGTATSPRVPPGGEIAAGAGMLDKLEAQAHAIVEQSTQLLQRASALADNLSSLTAPAREATEHVAAMMSSMQAMIDENRVALRQSLAAIRQTATGASDLLDGQIGQLVASVGDTVSELKKLVTANEGPLRAAVFDLRQASRSFKELARDVRDKPSRLLFSQAPPDRKLP
jgi:phospholipid/cholesterol/gamma-HCH transport system substrate-binding protein